MSSTENTTAKMTPTTPLTPPSTPRRQKSERKARTPDEPEEKFYSPKTQHALPSPPASPPQVRSESPDKDKSLSENTRRPSASELRTKLGIQTRCGAMTKKGGYCKNPSSYSEEEINKQIESMISCSASSAKLEELHKLIQLVHCEKHHEDRQMFLRAQDWMPVFDLKASVGNQIYMALQYYQPTCVGWVETKGRPCLLPIKGWRMTGRGKDIKIILKSDTYLDDESLEIFLRNWKNYMFCQFHINQAQAPKKVEEWKENLQNIREANPNNEDSSAKSAFPNIERALWKRQSDEPQFCFIDKSDDDKPVHKLLETPIEKEYLKEGHVYAFTNDANQGYVKIGYTTLPPEIRLQRWKEDCNRKFISLYPLSPTPMKVPNAHRVEELCHAELKHHNKWISCDSCRMTHVEWFKVSPEEAIAVIEKWSKWMRTEPYTKSGTPKKEEFWKVKNMGKFMERLSASYISEN